MWHAIIIIGIVVALLVGWFVRHQWSLKQRAHLMQEAIRNGDFTFRLPTDGLLPGERAMQQTLNHLGDTVRQQVNRNEVESWERLTRVLTHEIMNATAPITSISQSMLGRDDVKGTPLEPGIQAIYDTSRHLNNFVANYRKMSELEKPVLADVTLRTLLDDIRMAYPQLTWEIRVTAETIVLADVGMLRQVLMNLTKNAIESDAKNMVVEAAYPSAEANYSLFLRPFGSKRPEVERTPHASLQLCIGNDGLPIPAENRQSLFVPFFTTKRSGSGIGLSLSRRMMIQQGGMLDLAERPQAGCSVGFVLTVPLS